MRKMLVSLLAAGLVLAACGSDGEVLDAELLASEMEEALDDEGIDADVECPEDRAVEEGDEFECDGTTDAELEFTFDVVQRGDGEVDFELSQPILLRTALEEAIVAELQPTIQEDIVADCSQELDEQFLGENGQSVICGVGGVSSGEGIAAQVTIVDAREGTFEVEVIEGSAVFPEEEAAPADDDGEVLVADGFDADVNGWGTESRPGFTAGIRGGVLRFDATAEARNSLPYEMFPDSIETLGPEMDFVQAQATVVIEGGGRVFQTCLADPTGDDFSSYLFSVGAGEAILFESDADGNLSPFASSPVEVEPGVPFEFLVACGELDGEMSLLLMVDGEEILFSQVASPMRSAGLVTIGAEFDPGQPDSAGFTVLVDDYKVVEFD